MSEMMTIKPSRLLMASPALVVLIIAAIKEGTTGVYVGAGLADPTGLDFVNRMLLISALGWWLRKDSPGVTRLPYCLGLFLISAWPIVMIYHLFKSRGVRGLIPIAVFLIVYVGAIILGLAIGFGLRA